MPGVCKVCGAALPRRKRSYCSEECKREGLKVYQRVKVRKPRPPSALYTERACIDCGTITLMHIKSKRCPQCQAEANLKSGREGKRRQNAGVTRKLGSTDLCQRCGQPYIVNAGLQRYCKACASIAAQENDRVKSRDLAREKLKDPEYREARNAKRRAARRQSGSAVSRQRRSRFGAKFKKTAGDLPLPVEAYRRELRGGLSCRFAGGASHGSAPCVD